MKSRKLSCTLETPGGTFKNILKQGLDSVGVGYGPGSKWFGELSTSFWCTVWMEDIKGLNFFHHRWDYPNSSHHFSYTCHRCHVGTTIPSFLSFFVTIKGTVPKAVSRNSGEIYTHCLFFSFAYAVDSFLKLISLLALQSSPFDQTSPSRH